MDSKALKTFYLGLKTFDSYLFPLSCKKCGKEFKSLEDFLESTNNINSNESGLSEFSLGNKISVGLFRNCVCNTTLFGEFSNRRDESTTGKERRNEFEKLLDILLKENDKIENNKSIKELTDELRKIVRGEKSNVLEKMGIVFNTIK